MSQLVREQARRVVRAWGAWEWVRVQLETSPPTDDGLRHPEVDASELLADTVMRALHDLVRIAGVDELGMIEALVDAGLSRDDATSLGRRHAAWLLEEEV